MSNYIGVCQTCFKEFINIRLTHNIEGKIIDVIEKICPDCKDKISRNQNRLRDTFQQHTWLTGERIKIGLMMLGLETLAGER